MKKRRFLIRVGAAVVAGVILAGSIYAGFATSAHIGKGATRRALRANDAEVQGEYAPTSAKAMCTLNAETGEVLYEKNADQQLPMASTTKIVTTIAALENCDDIDTPVEIDPRAVGIEGTSIYLQKGEKLTVRELLLGVMLRSGNDASSAVAWAVCPKGDFMEKMNEVAKRAGATQSNFMNPHGLDQEGHYTTARDLALVTAYAMKNPTFAEIVATKEARIAGKDYPRVVRNKNRLLHSMENCVGVKTGFTKKAGRCYVGALTFKFDDEKAQWWQEKRGPITVVCCVLNCGPMFEEAADLMERGIDDILLSCESINSLRLAELPADETSSNLSPMGESASTEQPQPTYQPELIKATPLNLTDDQSDQTTETSTLS